MSITVAKSAGFCFGVSRAVETVEREVKAGKQVATLGPIIHNRHAVRHFEDVGVSVIQSPEDAVPGSTVIIRSHGVSRAVYQRLQNMGVEVVDATCPFVKRIHEIVSREEKEGYIPVIIGTRSHPEVEGIAGWCSNCRICNRGLKMKIFRRICPFAWCRRQLPRKSLGKKALILQKNSLLT